MTPKVVKVSTTTSVVNVLRWGYEFTSLAGIAQIRADNCKFAKCVWLLIFIIGFCLTAYQVISALQTFAQYNTETSISLRNKVKIDFPSVTVCNQNRVHCRHLYNLILECNQVSILESTLHIN